MSKGRNNGGPYIRNGHLVGAGNKFEAVKGDDGKIKFVDSVQKQEQQKRPNVDSKIQDRKEELEQQKDKNPDKQKQRDKNIDKDREQDD